MSVSAASTVSVSCPQVRQLCERCTSRHGFSRPCPPSAGSTNPYLASIPRWYEQLATLSPVYSAHRVAVAECSRPSSSIRDQRVGWDSARSARGSLMRSFFSGGTYVKVSCARKL